MMVYALDINDFYIGFAELTEENKDTLNYTTKPMTIGYIKPRFDKTIQDWVEGATPQEIAEWEETNKPKPIPPDKTEILEQEVSRLEIEMLKMKKGMV